MKKELSRREFLKGSALGGLGLAVAIIVGCEEEPISKIKTSPPDIFPKTPTPKITATPTQSSIVEIPKPAVTAQPALETALTPTTPYPEQTPLITPTLPQTNLPTLAETLTQQTEVGYFFDNGVSEEDKDDILQGVKMIKDWLNVNLQVDVEGDVIVYGISSKTDTNELAQARGQNRIYQLIIYTSHDYWKKIAPTERKKIIGKVTGHEYFHILQRELSGISWHVPFKGPYWLFEGSAEFVGFQAIVYHGLMNSEEAKTFQINQVKSANLPPLQSLESKPSWDSTVAVRYSLGHLAVELLTREVGIKTLTLYFKGLTQPGDWRPVFKKAFGTDVDSFYQRFEEFRQQWTI